MTTSIDRRVFLKRAGTVMTGAATASVFPNARARAAAGDRLAFAVPQWGTETPFAWRSAIPEKVLWDCIHDPVIVLEDVRVPARPCPPSNEMRTWTFKLRSGVTFHEGWGELTADDFKFTVEQNLKPDSGGCAALDPPSALRLTEAAGDGQTDASGGGSGHRIRRVARARKQRAVVPRV